MRIVVSGVGGMIGASLALSMHDVGHMVVPTTRRPTAHAQRLERAGLSVRYCDLISEGLPIAEFDAIVHCAGTSPSPTTHSAQICLDNVTATARVAEAAERAGARLLVYMSSLSVYGPIRSSEVDDASPRVDPDVYGASKYIAECIIKEAAPALCSVAIRLPGVLGPGAARNFLAQTRKDMLSHAPITAYNPAAPFNNACHVSDLARFVQTLLGTTECGFHAVTVGAADHMPVRNVLDLIRTRLHSKSDIAFVQSTRTSFTISNRAAVSMGYSPMGMCEMLETWLREEFDSETQSPNLR